MKYLAQMDPRFRGLGLKVGTFLAVLGVLLALMAALLGWRQDFFHPMVSFSASPERAEDLFVGMDVTLHGIRVGRASAVFLGDEGTPVVKFRIRENAAQWLREGATIRLSGLDPLGTPFLNIYPGPKEAPPLPPESRIPFERELTIAETVAVLERHLVPIIEEAGRLVEEINDPEGDLRKSLANFQSLTAALAQEIPPALEDARSTARITREFLEEFTSDDADLAKILNQWEEMTQQAGDHLPLLLEETEQSLRTLRKTVEQIEKTTQNASPELLEMLRHSKETAAKAEGLMEDVRDIWLMKLLLPRRDR